MTMLFSVGSSPPAQLASSAQVASTINTVDSSGDVGLFTSLALDSSGFPVVSYFDASNEDLKLVHCNDASCAGGDESIVTVDSVGRVGRHTSLVLDSSGFPVVVYGDSTNVYLKLVHCNDANCAGGDESIVTLDSAGNVGSYNSLALDGSGFPVISSANANQFGPKLVHCNDANCVGGDESIGTVDSAIIRDSSLALDASGFPVVSYRDLSNTDLKLTHCNDPNCAGGDESIVTVDSVGNVGMDPSLALDGSGFPVVSYFDGFNGLKLAHCNDPNCAGGDESIVTVDSGITGMDDRFTSLVLDSSGFPVVAYRDLTTYELKLVHCNDANCAGGDESIIALDSGGNFGWYPSLVLDASGNPVVSYYDKTNGDLKVLQCGTPTCTAAAPGPDFRIHPLTGFQPPDPMLMEPTFLTVWVENAGGTYIPELGSADLIITLRESATANDYTLVYERSLDPLSPGDMQALSFPNFLFFSEKIDEVEFCVIADDPESDPTNNCLTMGVTVTGNPDGVASCIGVVWGTFDALLEGLPLGEVITAGRTISGYLTSLYSLISDCGSSGNERACFWSTTSLLADLVVEIAELLGKAISGQLLAVGKAIIVALSDAPVCGPYLRDIISSWVLASKYKDANVNAIVAESPIFVRVIDSSGRRAGFLDDGTIVTEIPDSEVVVAGDMKFILYPGSDTTTVELKGTGSGTFDLLIAISTSSGGVEAIEYVGVSVTPSTTGDLDVTTSAHLLYLDDDNDDIPDRQVEPTTDELFVPTTLFLPLIADSSP